MKKIIWIVICFIIGSCLYYEIPIVIHDTKMQMEFEKMIPTKEKLEETFNRKIVKYRLDTIETPLGTGIKSFFKKNTSYYLGIYDHTDLSFYPDNLILDIDDLKCNIEFEFAYHQEELRKNYLDLPENSKLILENEQYNLYVNQSFGDDKLLYTPYGYIQKEDHIVYYSFNPILQDDFETMKSELINTIEILIPIL